MLIPLGILAAAGASAPASAGSYDLLATTILSSSQSSVTFSSLDSYSGYQHLQLRMTTKDDTSGQNALSINLKINADSGSNYSWHQLGGNGSSVSSSAGTSTSLMNVGLTAGAASTANAFSATVVDILDPFEITKYTTFRGLTGLTSGNFIRLYSGLWQNTAALTSIEIQGEGSGNFISGSRFSLYGLRSA